MQFTLSQLDDTYRWLCRQRKHFPPDADIWHFRFRYARIKHALLWWINSGQYRFSPQQKIIKSDGQVIHLWGLGIPRSPGLFIPVPLQGVCPEWRCLKLYFVGIPQALIP